jgi:hypothetical protein
MYKFEHKPFAGLQKLWVVTALSNPQRYKSRYALFEQFRDHVYRAGANLMIVETAFGDRPHEHTRERADHLSLRTSDELWHKENMLNLGISRLPSDWEYVAWIDADVAFTRPDWVTETVHQLQHYQVIQMFQSAIDLGPEGEALQTVEGFMASYLRGRALPLPGAGYYSQGWPNWHPGYAWAARRDAFESLGGLFDKAVLGAGDRHMAWALLGHVEASIQPNLSPAYVRHLKQWEDRANRHIRQNVGYMPGTITHHWHGKKKDRRYHDRWEILTRHGYDPDVDIKRDAQGLYQFSDQGARMRNDIRAYFRSRNEDSIDTE